MKEPRIRMKRKTGKKAFCAHCRRRVFVRADGLRHIHTRTGEEGTGQTVCPGSETPCDT